LNPFVIDAPALEPEPPVRKPPAPLHLTQGQLADAAVQLLLLNWGFLNKGKSTAAQWMSAVFGGKMCVNGPI